MKIAGAEARDGGAAVPCWSVRHGGYRIPGTSWMSDLGTRDIGTFHFHKCSITLNLVPKLIFYATRSTSANTLPFDNITASVPALAVSVKPVLFIYRVLSAYAYVRVTENMKAAAKPAADTDTHPDITSGHLRTVVIFFHS